MDNLKKLSPEICISISSNPGNFGTTVHNAGFKKLGLNYIYKALKVDDLNEVIKAIKVLKIKGCSVSMPFKEKILNFLDSKDELVENSGAANTIVNKNGKLAGHNTDIKSVISAILNKNYDLNDTVLILGAGGMAKSVIYALQNIGFSKITVSARKENALIDLRNRFSVDSINIKDISDYKSDILINATSIGMPTNKNDFPITENDLKKYKMIIDVVVSMKPTKLIENCKKNKIQFIDGFTLSLNQALEQFRLYTDREPPIEVMKKAALSLLNR